MKAESHEFEHLFLRKSKLVIIGIFIASTTEVFSEINKSYILK
jgi:hypothetical protein